MFDDLKEKIDDLVSSIKSKLPGSNSDDDDEYEDEEGEFDEKTEEINVSSKSPDSEEEIEEEEDDEDEDEDEVDEDEAKAKKQKFMRLGLVAVVLVLGASILMEDGSDDTLPESRPVVRKKRPKRKKKVIKKAEVQEKEKKAADKKEPTVAEPVKVAEEAPVKVVEEAPVKVVEEAPVKVVEEVPVKQPPVENVQVIENKLKLVDDNPEVDPSTIVPVDQGNMGGTPSLGEGNVSQNNEKSNEMSQVIDSLTNSGSSEMIKKVVKEKLEYQEPPNYLETGRGLVYNCTGKHWACVDQESFINCRKNSEWSEENNKDPECFPKNVYESFKDCRTIQLYNINTNLETDFCKK